MNGKKKRPRIKVAQRSILMAASTGILLGIGYTPAPKPKPDRQFIAKTYIRPTGPERKRASERRKMEILAEIRKIRKYIRLQAETYQLDHKTIKAYSAREKTNIHCTRLIVQLGDQINKRERHESYMGTPKLILDLSEV